MLLPYFLPKGHTAPPPPAPHVSPPADIMNPIRNKPSPDDSVAVAGAPAKQRKLTYPDLKGYKEFVSAFLDSPVDYADRMPTAPVVDASQWIEANFKEVGWGGGLLWVGSWVSATCAHGGWGWG
jgi:hypothetical protein